MTKHLLQEVLPHNDLYLGGSEQSNGWSPASQKFPRPKGANHTVRGLGWLGATRWGRERMVMMMVVVEVMVMVMVVVVVGRGEARGGQRGAWGGGGTGTALPPMTCAPRPKKPAASMGGGGPKGPAGGGYGGWP